MMLVPNDIASDNVSPHVVGTKGPVVHLAHLVEILNSNDFPKHGNYDHHKMIALKDESYDHFRFSIPMISPQLYTVQPVYGHYLIINPCLVMSDMN